MSTKSVPLFIPMTKDISVMFKLVDIDDKVVHKQHQQHHHQQHWHNQCNQNYLKHQQNNNNINHIIISKINMVNANCNKQQQFSKSTYNDNGCLLKKYYTFTSWTAVIKQNTVFLNSVTSIKARLWHFIFYLLTKQLSVFSFFLM